MASKRRVRRLSVAAQADHEARSCGEKMQHQTQTQAVAAAISLVRRRGGQQMSTYLCVHCGWWHVGHRSLVKRKKVIW